MKDMRGKRVSQMKKKSKVIMRLNLQMTMMILTMTKMMTTTTTMVEMTKIMVTMMIKAVALGKTMVMMMLKVVRMMTIMTLWKVLVQMRTKERNKKARTREREES